MEKRARRIADKQRMKARARRIGRLVNVPGYHVHADHLAVCSCWMCGNPRTHFGLRTRQERAHEEASRPDLGRPDLI